MSDYTARINLTEQPINIDYPDSSNGLVDLATTVTTNNIGISSALQYYSLTSGINVDEDSGLVTVTNNRESSDSIGQQVIAIYRKTDAKSYPNANPPYTDTWVNDAYATQIINVTKLSPNLLVNNRNGANVTSVPLTYVKGLSYTLTPSSASDNFVGIKPTYTITCEDAPIELFNSMTIDQESKEIVFYMAGTYEFSVKVDANGVYYSAETDGSFGNKNVTFTIAKGDTVVTPSHKNVQKRFPNQQVIINTNSDGVQSYALTVGGALTYNDSTIDGSTGKITLSDKRKVGDTLTVWVKIEDSTNFNGTGGFFVEAMDISIIKSGTYNKSIKVRR